jgi:site-specific recombinase XerD
MIRVSFYLNSPKAKQSPVYVSITENKNRLRFPTDQTFLTDHITKRKKKGKSFLVKGMPHYFTYNKILDDIEEELHNYCLEFIANNEQYTLAKIKEKYESKRKPVVSTELDFFYCYDQFVSFNMSKWTLGTQNHFRTLRNHLIEFEKEVLKEKLLIKNVNEDTNRQFRDDFLVEIKKISNRTSNQYLKKFKQFCKFAIKKEWITNKVDLDDFNRLKEAETFNIALKKHELDTLINLNLTENKRLDRVRDLFLLEIYTGQRYSDIPQIINLTEDVSESIILYQKKTFGKAYIPLHDALIQHLSKIKIKNYADIASISSQKFNEYLKEIGKMMKMDKVHHWKILIGIDQISKSDFRYNLLTSHVGRRTFCTLALKNKIPTEYIMKVSGHKSYNDFKKYVKLDDEDLDIAFENFLSN